MDMLKVNYNKTDGSFTNRQGVEIRPIDFGGFGGIDYIAMQFEIPIQPSVYTAVFHDIAKSRGYEAGTNLFGATVRNCILSLPSLHHFASLFARSSTIGESLLLVCRRMDISTVSRD